MELVLIRHGLPIRQENPEGAPADPPLSEEGKAQAEAAAQWLALERFDALYASPLLRARETAAPLARLQGLAIEIEPGVIELDHESERYVPLEELKAEDPEAWKAMLTAEGYGGVDLPAFRVRVVAALETMIDRHPGGRVAVACHGGVVNAWASHLLQLEEPLFFEPAYTSVSRFIAASTGERSIRSLNETGHLRGA
ncbi:MAG: histidine phosphatase family protein [bacterium]|nr:histidine phosphatase family protein [bacterium]